MIDLKDFKELVKRVKLTTQFDTQKKIALELGCNNRYLSGILNGKMALADKFVEKFAVKFNLNLVQENAEKQHKEPVIEGLLNNNMSINIPREVFDLIRTQVETIQSQQKTIEEITTNMEKYRVARRSIKQVS